MTQISPISLIMYSKFKCHWNTPYKKLDMVILNVIYNHVAYYQMTHISPISFIIYGNIKCHMATNINYFMKPTFYVSHLIYFVIW